MAFIESVAVLFTSGDEENSFIGKLEAGGYVLEYSHIKQQQNKQPETIVHLNLRKYKERKVPMIVLITSNFLESMWPTIYKESIIKDITKYVTRYCVHIWLSNLDEFEMRKYSSVMCRTGGPFRRVKEKELGIEPVEIVRKLRKIMSDTHEIISLENYSVQEEEEERKLSKEMKYQPAYKIKTNMPSMSFDESYASLKLSSISLTESEKAIAAAAALKSSIPPKQHNKAKKKKQETGYKLSANSMSEIVRDNIPSNSGPSPPTSLEGAPSSSSSKRRKKKKKTLNSYMSDVTYHNLYQISLLLDVGFGANWKQMASSYGVDSITIQNIELALKRQESPTMNLLSLLRIRKPELTIGDFLEKCKNIARHDVVKLIEQDVLKP